MPSTWFTLGKLWIYAVLIIVVFGVIWSGRPQPLFSKSADWNIKGTFIEGGVYPATRFGNVSTSSEFSRSVCWGSWAGSDANTGELKSPSFPAPSFLELFVAGYPNQPHNSIFLEVSATKERIPLNARVPGEHWEQLYFWIPSRVRGKAVNLVAVDGETGPAGWLGIASPRALNWLGLVREQFMADCDILLYPLEFALFLLPGFALALRFAKIYEIRASYLVILVITTNATLGYISFWAFFASKPSGKFISLASVCIALVSLAADLSRVPRLRKVFRTTIPPFLYSLIVGVFYLSVFYLFSDPVSAGAELSGRRFFQGVRPGDQVIPLIFANKIYDHQPLKPFCCGDWLSSDRPPLQAGLFLFQRPLRTFGDVNLNYQLFGSAMQCFWVCGVWVLLDSLGVSNPRIQQVLGLLTFSGFLLYNSTYPWPKLLAATFTLFVLAIMIKLVRDNRTITALEVALAAISFSLAMMAHPGSIFSLPGFIMILLFRWKLFPIQQVALGLLIIGVFVTPWLAYQKFVDPPGNRLLKMHLASRLGIDSLSTWQAVKDSYRRQSVKTTLLYKWDNIRYLLGPRSFDGLGLNALEPAMHINRAVTEETRVDQRDFIWNAIGVLNLGWLAAAFVLVRREGPVVPYGGWLIVASVFNFLIWSVVTFGPCETATPNSSYADIILLSIGLCGLLLMLPRFIVLAVLALQIFNLVVVWVWSGSSYTISSASALTSLPIQLPFAFLGLGCAFVLVRNLYLPWICCKRVAGLAGHSDATL